MKKITLIAIIFVSFTLNGCFKSDDKEVNDANCTPESIKKITNKKEQMAFSSLCFRR